MKPKAKTGIVSRLGEHEANAFTVAVNNQTFSVLLDTLYTNKVRAVIRELWTNAYDAHVAAGCADAPFSCKLPTALDPTFSVRDYGVSMTHDEVMHLYTTVFESSKTHTNELVGQLGLGSKSPFAYTDAFTVTAWLDGVKRVYLASLGEDGVPTITHMSEDPDEGPRGVEVSFPVQARHFTEFKDEAARVARGFDVPPTVIHGELKAPEYEFRGDGWRVEVGGDHAVRQGCVIYPLTENQIHVSPGLGYRHGLIVDVPIGTVQVAANREALSLDDETRDVVKELFASVAEQVEAAVLEDVYAATSLVEANRRWLQAKDALPRLRNVHYRNDDSAPKLTGTIRPDDDIEILDHQEKAIRNRTFNVQDLDLLTFIVDRTGMDVKRKRRRFWEFRKTVARQHLYVLRDPSKAQLKSLVKRLELRPNQVRSIASLPDVVTAPRVKDPNAERHIGGVYEVKDGIATKVKELVDDFVWFEIPRYGARDVNLGLLGGLVHFNMGVGILDGIHQDLQAAAGTKEPLYLFVPGAARYFKPNPMAELSSLAAAYADGQRAQACKTARLVAIRDDLVSHSRHRFTDAVHHAVCPELADLANQPKTKRWVANFLTSDLDEATEQGSVLARDTMSSYPLIYDAYDEEAVLEYIQAVNTKGGK